MIFAVACEAVEESGRPVARRTHREIADEVVKRGIMESISLSHLSTLLAEAQLQRHKSRYWLNTKEKGPEAFDEQVRMVCRGVTGPPNSKPNRTRTRSEWMK